METQRLEDHQKLAQLSATMTDVTNRMRNHAADRKWTTDNAKRIGAMEGQLRD